MPGPVTLSQVAREAGVSLATASRAINGSATRVVRPDLRERVLATAARMRYVPDGNAQAMARGQTRSVGLIVADIADPCCAAIAAGVSEAADRAGLAVTLACTQHDGSREPRIVEVLTRQRARAVILVGGRPGAGDGTDGGTDDGTDDDLRAALDDFRASGGSVVLVGQPLPGLDTVVIENRSSAGALARSLHERGYRRFGVLAGPPGDPTARDRRTGFGEALDALGCPVDPSAVVASAATRDGGYDAMRRLLAAGRDLDTVFAVGDCLAVGAVAAARDAGVRVPDDVAVAGFDDLDAVRDLTPALSTVRLPLVDIGVRATELALLPPSAEPRLVPVAGTVVLRASTPSRRS